MRRFQKSPGCELPEMALVLLPKYGLPVCYLFPLCHRLGRRPAPTVVARKLSLLLLLLLSQQEVPR